jgi:ParB/RepB/Spo0J family partition protein
VQSHQPRLDRSELGKVSTQVERARHPGKVVAYLEVDLVDPSPEARNSRQRYDEASINELATSIQEHGVLQPILVSPKDDGRYDTIFGNRRLLASRRAGNKEIPAVVREGVTEREKFVWNLVENIQRQNLSSKERADSIRALAGSGGGVREICRWTGKDPGTISRWLRIGNKPVVMHALEQGRIDIAHAQYLAPVVDEEKLSALIDQAPDLSMPEFAQLAKSVVVNNVAYSIDDGRLADIDRKLAKIRVVTPIGLAHLERILARALELRSQGQTDGLSFSGQMVEDDATTATKSLGHRGHRDAPVAPTEIRAHRRTVSHQI